MAVITITPTVEMIGLVPLVDEDGDTLVDENGNTLVGDGWVDVTADVLSMSNPTWTRGNSGRTIFDRVANVGTFNFALNNSQANANATLGYYSPDHASVSVRFGIDSEVRLTLTDGVTTYQEWQGRITSIYPSAGQYRDRQTLITCEDWMANAYRDKIKGVTVQSGKRDDEIITSLLTLASFQPLSTSLSTGDDTYTYALHDENSLTSTLARIFQKLAMSGQGKIFLSGYSTLNYVSRSDIIVSGTPAATLSDTMTDLKVSRSKGQRVKEVNVTTYPVEVDPSAVVLWQAQKEVTLSAGETITFDISFRDPNSRATRIAALSLTTPVADTDYKLSSTSGSGNDLNSSLSISVTLKADIATITLKNISGTTGYLWLHQQRGIGVYLYEPVTQTAETGQPDGETLNIDMVYQDDENVGTDILNLITYFNVVDESDVESVTFIANSSQDLTDAAFLDINSLVTITETLTGIDENFLINGTSKTLLPGNILKVTWYLTKANQLSGVWFLGVSGMSELDSTTYLGA